MKSKIELLIADRLADHYRMQISLKEKKRKIFFLNFISYSLLISIFGIIFYLGFILKYNMF